MSECVICRAEIEEKVYMTCRTRHSICFKCTVLSVEKNKKLMKCPICRGGGDGIILEDFSQENSINSNNFYSVGYFSKCMNLVHLVATGTTEPPNTCIATEKELIFYVNNKNQLDMANTLREKYSKKDIIENIKWKGDSRYKINASSLENLASALFYPSSESIGGYIESYTNTIPTRESQNQ